MAYSINNYNGTPVATVVDGTISTILDLTLIGKNYAGYGQSLNDNFVWLLENFAGNQPPKKPIAGELWFDNTTANLKINVYDGAAWKTLAVSNISATAPTAHTVGDLWYDSVNNQLNVWNGTTYLLVGPQSVAGFGQTQTVSAGIADNAVPSAIHAVQQAYANGQLLYIVSADPEFTPADSGIAANFPIIYPGITLSTNFKVYGTATNADNLGNEPASYYAPLRNTVFPTLTTFSAGLTTGGAVVNNSSIQAVGNVLTLGTNSNGTVTLTGSDILPSTTATSNIGSSTLQFQNIYASYVYSIAQKSDKLNLGGAYVSATTTNTPNTVVGRDTLGSTSVNNLTATTITSGNITSSGSATVATSITSPFFFGHTSGKCSYMNSINVVAVRFRCRFSRTAR
jgi:orotidine-5'-phosphate decarboxylase